jgi:hypothetical protein
MEKNLETFMCHLYMETLVTESCLKDASRFLCEKCNYKTNKKSSFNKHINTEKHKVTKCDIPKVLSDTKVAYNCKICNKVYRSRNGLWVHKNKGECIMKNEKIIETKLLDTNNKTEQDKELLMMIIKQNAELMEIIKNGINKRCHN